MTVHVFLHDEHSDWELGYLLPELRTAPAVPEIPKSPRRVSTLRRHGISQFAKRQPD